MWSDEAVADQDTVLVIQLQRAGRMKHPRCPFCHRRPTPPSRGEALSRQAEARKDTAIFKVL